ncbi:3-oxoacyl-ACP synthase III family protein [Nonomuraea sp. ATR24]|uniref:3-oxoacyl-ACP synthase III family protein n=1 Tax=Nonomuraea sp. ATR24 TaxID=1676744 RepID=UPI0035C23DD8
MGAPLYAQVTDVALHLPGTSLTTAELEDRLADLNPGVPIPRKLIECVTGVSSRHVADADQRARDLAVTAARDLLARTGHPPAALDLIIFAGVSLDAVEPATAHMVAAELGAGCAAFDVRNACNSVLNAIELADTLITARRYRTVLVVCGEVATSAIRWRVGCEQEFRAAIPSYTVSDSGAALLLEAAAVPGIMGHRFCAVPEFWPAAVMPFRRLESGGHVTGPFTVDAVGLAVAVHKLDLDVLTQPLREHGVGWDDLAAICVHQASLPSLRSFCEGAGIPLDKVVVTIAEHGNLVAATLPAQLHEAARSGRVRRGDLVALVGVASGLSAGTVLLRW